jgi:hypothetical protein
MRYVQLSTGTKVERHLLSLQPQGCGCLTITVPPVPSIRLSIGVTGHRAGNAAFAANRGRIELVLGQVLDLMQSALGEGTAPVRLHCLLADGTDQIAATGALERGWELVAPLPFGRDLNVAINAGPETVAEAQALIGGGDALDMTTQARAASIRELTASAKLFELAERDALLAKLYLDKLAAPTDLKAAEAFSVRCSARVALAGRVMIEQSDIIIGIWDGVSRAFVGGTGHTISEALEHGAPVVWIDAHDPESWRILYAPEALAVPNAAKNGDREAELAGLIYAALHPDSDEGTSALQEAVWHPRSNRWWTGYRRIEALFGGDGKPFRSLTQTYETPEAIANGSAASVLTAARALPSGDMRFVDRLDDAVLRRFAWADGVSAWLSDAYRGGMIANFLLSTFAVVGGILYQPLGATEHKWIFAGAEFLMLAAILLITALGGMWRWHGRWFETRRVAEYFRHAPILLLLGVARAPGRWPKGGDVNWPEHHARHALRELGLPHVAITPAYLRHALTELLDPHIFSQRDYHEDKAKRLTAVHHNLDALSTRLFQLAVVSVSTYLLLKGGAALHLLPEAWPKATSELFAFLGVTFPTFGAAIAGIRYFGDFERFAAISEVTAAKLDGVHSRISLLLEARDERIDYARVSELAHAADDVVVSEIENWQAVFGGKHIAVPV